MADSRAMERSFFMAAMPVLPIDSKSVFIIEGTHFSNTRELPIPCCNALCTWVGDAPHLACSAPPAARL